MHALLLIILLAFIPTDLRAQGGDNCPGAMLNCNSCVTGATFGYTNNHDCGEGHTGPDVVYHLMLPEASTITLIGEADFDADWTIASICDDTSGDILCSDWLDPHVDPSCGSIAHAEYGYLNFTTELPAGTYYLWIDGFYSDSAGAYSVELLCDAAPVPTHTPSPAIPGDHCDVAIEISAAVNAGVYPQTIPGDSTLANSFYDLASCSFEGATGPELVYAFTPDSTRSLSFDLCAEGGTLTDSILYVRYDGVCPGNLEAACDDDGCNSPASDLLSVLSCREYQAGTTYYLFVDASSGGMPGSFTLNIDQCAMPQCDPASLAGQIPHSPDDFWTAVTSDRSMIEDFQAFEKVDLGSAASLCSVQWWGLMLVNVGDEWFGCSKDVDFAIDFYADSSGQPGAIMGSQVVAPVRSDLGVYYTGYPLYSYQADLLPCIDFSGGWMSIQALESATSPECWFFWMSSPYGDMQSYQWNGTQLGVNPVDLGFCVMGSILTPTPAPTDTPPMPTSTPSADDNCPGLEMLCNTCITGSTAGYLNDHDCGEGHAGPDAVYNFTLPVAATITLIGEADFDADWTLASTCDDLNSDLGCFDWTDPHADPSCGTIVHATYGYVQFSTFLPAGVYYIWVDGFYFDSAGDFALELLCDVSPTAVPTATTTPSVPGDHCDNAIDLSPQINAGIFPLSIPGDSSMATNYYALASCSFNGADGPELVYSFTPDQNRTLTFDLCSSGGTIEDSVIYIRLDGPCPGNLELVCDDDSCSTPATDLLSITNCREFIEGTTYYLFIDSYSGSMPGSFTLNVNACVAPQCNPDSLTGQNPHMPEDFWTAFISDQSMPESFQAYENIDFAATATVCGVQWWGLMLENIAGEWMACSKSVDYTVIFYADAAGLPGDLIESRQVTPSVTDVGLAYSGYPLYLFSVDLAPCVEFTGGWISVQAMESPGSPDCWFLWLSSPDGDAQSYQWDGMGFVANASDVSLCIDGFIPTPTPTSTHTLPPTSTASPTYSPIPPTSTPIPFTVTPTSTATQIPPTYTSVPATQTPTFTSTPTDTPVPPTATPPPVTTTPTAIPTETPTFTSVPATRTPTPTASATQIPTTSPTPVCSQFGVTIEMPGTFFTPGMNCYLNVELCNPGTNLTNIPLFVVLEILGTYFFYPSWCSYPDDCPGADYEMLSTVFTGLTAREIIPNFIWPQVNETITQIHLYSAMVDLEAGVLIGEMGFFEFGYGF